MCALASPWTHSTALSLVVVKGAIIELNSPAAREGKMQSSE
jgi:hypothetical protein